MKKRFPRRLSDFASEVADAICPPIKIPLLPHMILSATLRALPIMGLALFLALAAGCERDPMADLPASDEVDEAAESYEYEAYLGGMIVDTLSGPAAFGRVTQAGSSEGRFIIQLRNPSDMTDGLFLTRPQSDLEPGTYPVVTDADDPDGFRIVYREGVRRSFTGTSGEVIIATVSDTLIEGRLKASFEGRAMPPGEPEIEGELDVVGAFRAVDGEVGFVVGL